MAILGQGPLGATSPRGSWETMWRGEEVGWELYQLCSRKSCVRKRAPAVVQS